MSKQSIVYDNFWADEWVDSLDPSEKLVFLYLITNSNRNLIGAYKISLKRMAFETGFEKDMVEKIIDRFVKDGKIQRIDGYIIIVNGMKYQTPNPNMVKKMEKQINELPPEVRNALVTITKGFQTLPYLTLLNLTKPNSAEPISEEEKMHIQKSSGVVKLRKKLGWKTPFGNINEMVIAERLIKQYKYPDIIALMKAYEENRKEPFMPVVNNLGDFESKYPAIKAKLEDVSYERQPL